ncbi:NCS1 family transporter [Lachnospiraceae bacterium 62-35]
MANNSANQAESLRPQEERIFNSVSYFLMWIGGCIAIAVFTVGSSLVGQLNLLQIVTALLVGTIIIAACLVVNGHAGHVYGIPYTIQLRSSFGVKGAKIPGMIRAVPAVVWFGFQTWVGAEALNAVCFTLFKFDNVAICYVGFTILQIVLSMTGFKGIKWIEDAGSICIIVALVYMFYSVVTKYGIQLQENVINIKGSWGLAFWGGSVAFVGQYSTTMLNVSDLSRQYKKEGKRGIMGMIYWLSIGPAFMLMGLTGLIVTAATGVIDPIGVFTSAIENPILLVFTLLFIIFAQITTNVVNNIVPPVYVLMDACKKMNYKLAVVAVGILSFCTFPWKLVTPESAAGLNLFIRLYSCFLGPIFAVMVTDYYCIRRKKLNLEVLYDENGPIKGINWAAIIAIAVGAAAALLETHLAWYSSLIPSAAVYYILMRYTGIGKSFLIGSAFEKKGEML